MNYISGLLTVFVLLSFVFVRGASGETFDRSHKLYGEVPLGEYRIVYTEYDWSLNDKSAKVK